jgi:hypothetical protein
MNLAGQAASRPAHRLLAVPRDACTVLMYADDRRVDHLHGGVGRLFALEDAIDATRRARC